MLPVAILPISQQKSIDIPNSVASINARRINHEFPRNNGYLFAFLFQKFVINLFFAYNIVENAGGNGTSEWMYEILHCL